jgi:hypothetical protein
MARRGVLVILLIVLASYPVAQYAICVAVSSVYLFLVVRVQPFDTLIVTMCGHDVDILNWSEIASGVLILLTQFVGLVFSAASPSLPVRTVVSIVVILLNGLLTVLMGYGFKAKTEQQFATTPSSVRGADCCWCCYDMQKLCALISHDDENVEGKYEPADGVVGFPLSTYAHAIGGKAMEDVKLMLSHSLRVQDLRGKTRIDEARGICERVKDEFGRLRHRLERRRSLLRAHGLASEADQVSACWKHLSSVVQTTGAVELCDFSSSCQTLA